MSIHIMESVFWESSITASWFFFLLFIPNIFIVLVFFVVHDLNILKQCRLLSRSHVVGLFRRQINEKFDYAMLSAFVHFEELINYEEISFILILLISPTLFAIRNRNFREHFIVTLTMNYESWIIFASFYAFDELQSLVLWVSSNQYA